MQQGHRLSSEPCSNATGHALRHAGNVTPQDNISGPVPVVIILAMAMLELG